MTIMIMESGALQFGNHKLENFLMMKQLYKNYFHQTLNCIKT
jgi:hypothetical protein